MIDRQKRRAAQILGLGLDNKDGHIRITQGENFSVLLGSENTHERLHETCVKINEKLDTSGKRLEDLSRDEFVDLLSEVDGG